MLSKLMTKKRKAGFTLIEILVVIVVIGLLFMFFIPRIGFAGDKAREAGVKADLRGYMIAGEQVLMENGGIATDLAGTVAEMNKLIDAKLQLTAATGVTSTLASPFKAVYTLAVPDSKTITVTTLNGAKSYVLTMVYGGGSVTKSTTGFGASSDITAP